MASRRDRKNLQRLAALAEAVAERSAAELRTKSALSTQLSNRLDAFDFSAEPSDTGRVSFATSGREQIWQIWQTNERRRLGILAERARLAEAAARRAYARAEARRQILEKLSKPE